MNRTIRAIIGAVLVLVIAFSTISICQNVGDSWKADVTEQKIYSLSEGTKSILSKLRQPVKVKLYYAKTAALKAPDQIRYFNNYYEFVKALLEEYVTQSEDMVELEVIDPRPFSEDEVEALRYGLQKFPITEEENFFFGLVLQTQFGVEKTIPFFSPDRQNFVEYDISRLIDSAITRQKTKVGVLSSLPVMGEDLSGYMAQMKRMQGQQPEPPWTIVEQLRQKYEVSKVPTDVNDINDVDILLIIHPKDLPEKTLFAIDQFVLKGGRTVVCLDPHCVADKPDQMQMQMRQQHSQNSNLDPLLRTWGLQMPENTLAGDRALMLPAPVGQNRRVERFIGLLGLKPPGCFNEDSVITANLNQVKVLFPGVLREVADTNTPDEDEQETPVEIEKTPLLTTTDTGNSWKPDSPFELRFWDASRLMDKFIAGTEPVPLGYLVTGSFKTSFPDGMTVEVPVEDESEESDNEPADANEPKTTTKHITGIKEAVADCAVVVYADVDFISDIPGLAYADWVFGKRAIGDNGALLLNTIDKLSGSGDLISIRSRGNFQRPFTVVEKIRRQAEAETAEEVSKLNAEIQGFTNELQKILSSAKEEEADVVGSSILQKQRELELKKRQAQRQLREVKATRRERIEHLGNILRNFNMLTAPGVILAIAIVLGMRRSMKRRRYVSHASDA